MRYSNERKAETRARVLREAAREIRAKGPDNVGVIGVMKRVGLTHGGFYAHFASKDALVVEAIDAMFEDARSLSLAIEADADPRSALRSYVEAYLSGTHRDARERGCPLPALAGDLARSAPAARERFEAGVSVITARLSRALQRLGEDDPDLEASSMLSQMVGAVSLARAMDGPASDTVLASARAALTARYGLEARS